MIEAIEILLKLHSEAAEDLERHSQSQQPNKYVLQKLNSQLNRLEYITELLKAEQEQQHKRQQEAKKRAEQRTEEREKLLIICLLHGIDDVNQWLQNPIKWLKAELIQRRSGKPTIRSYLAGKTITPEIEAQIKEIEALESIKTIQLPIAHLSAQWPQVEAKTTNKPITSFKNFSLWQNQNKSRNAPTT